MLEAHLAHFFSTKGLVLPYQLGEIRVGLAGSVRVGVPVPLSVPPSIAGDVHASAGAELADVFARGHVWAEVTDLAANRVRFDAIRDGRERWLRLRLHADGLVVVAEPRSDHLRIVSVTPAAGEHRGGVLVRAKFASHGTPSTFDSSAFIRVLAAETERMLPSPARTSAREDVAFLEPFHHHVDQMLRVAKLLSPKREYVLESASEAGSTPAPTGEDAGSNPTDEDVGVETLRLRRPEGELWPRLFAVPGTRVSVPSKHGDSVHLEVVCVEDEGETLVCQSADAPLAREQGIATLKPDLTPLRVMQRTLAGLLSGGRSHHVPLLDAFLRPTRLPAFIVGEEEGLAPLTPLNAEQWLALRTAMASPDVTLIHGPPGTGKTSVICEIVRRAVARGQRVLLVAPTHVALDNVLERIGDKDGVVAVRLGRADRVDEASQHYRLERRASSLRVELAARVDAAAASCVAGDPVGAVQAEWGERLRTGSDTVLGKLLLLGANLVCATPIGIATDRAFREVDVVFDLLIIDEASKATVSEFLVPATRARRWVLVGDHQQLAPHVDDEEFQQILDIRARRLFGELDTVTSHLAERLRRFFDQRQHTDSAARVRPWEDLVETVFGVIRCSQATQNLIARESVADGLDPDAMEHRLRALAAFAEGKPADLKFDLTLVPESERSLLGRLALWLKELVQLQRVALSSAFETLHRALGEGVRVVPLRTQYRMAPEISRFSNEVVYAGRIIDAEATKRHGLAIPGIESASIWIDTQFQEDRYQQRNHDTTDPWGGGNYRNFCEARIVEELVRQIVEWGLGNWNVRDARGRALPFDVGVLSFYVAQSVLLNQAVGRRLDDLTLPLGSWRRATVPLCPNGAPVRVHVSVVDRFQGQEKDVVVLSLARSNPVGRRGHIDNLNRLNVAVTRARHKRLIVGDSSTMVLDRKRPRPPEDLLVRLRDYCPDRRDYWGVR